MNLLPMDPSVELVRRVSSFTQKTYTEEDLRKGLPPLWTSFQVEESKKDKRVIRPDDIVIKVAKINNLRPDARICNVENYQYLQELKDVYANRNANKARKFLYPFEKVGYGLFVSRAGMKLANIDAIYNVTSTFGGLLSLRSNFRFNFGDVAAGPGGFTEYIQMRNMGAMGTGMTLKMDVTGKEANRNWNLNVIDRNRFYIEDGDDGTGNLYTQWRVFVRKVRGSYPQGIDLITGDGGFEIESDDPTDTDYSRQEFLSSRLLAAQIMIAISCLRDGGSTVIKIFDSVTSVSSSYLYLMSLLFEEFSLFKPLMSRPGNGERYIIGKNFRSKRSDLGPEWADTASIIQNKFENILDAYSNTDSIVSIFSDKLGTIVETKERGNQLLPYIGSEDFMEWLYKINTISIDLQINFAEAMKAYLDGTKMENLANDFDLRKCLIIWNLPDTPPFVNPKEYLETQRNLDSKQDQTTQWDPRKQVPRETFVSRGRGRPTEQRSRDTRSPKKVSIPKQRSRDTTDYREEQSNLSPKRDSYGTDEGRQLSPRGPNITTIDKFRKQAAFM